MPSQFYSNASSVLRRQRQNKRLSESDPRWRLQAGGGQGLYRKLREARQAAESDPRAATRLNALETRAREFQANRSELLQGLHKGGPAPVRPGVKFGNGGQPAKRKRFRVG